MHDFINVSGARFPATPILISPTRVQGEGSAKEIVAAIDRLNCVPEIDVIVVTRGGGSLEDLQAFNTEEVARAIVRSAIPVVSGVGHEVDVTIADLVADLRVPTPSAAAIAVLPDGQSLLARVENCWHRQQSAMAYCFEQMRGALERASAALQAHAPAARLAAQRQSLEHLWLQLTTLAKSRLEQAQGRVALQSARLSNLSPLAVLSRGYAIVKKTGTGRILRGTQGLQLADELLVRVGQGSFEASVTALGKDED